MLECIITETKDIEPVIYVVGSGLVGRPIRPSAGPRAQLRSGPCSCSGKMTSEHWYTAAAGNRLHAPGRGAMFVEVIVTSPYGLYRRCGSRRASSMRSRTRDGGRGSTPAPSRRACAERSSRTLRLLACDCVRAGAGAIYWVEPDTRRRRRKTTRTCSASRRRLRRERPRPPDFGRRVAVFVDRGPGLGRDHVQHARCSDQGLARGSSSTFAALA